MYPSAVSGCRSFFYIVSSGGLVLNCTSDSEDLFSFPFPNLLTTPELQEVSRETE